MKSRTKPAPRALPAAEVQISLPVQGVLRDVRHAFLGLCIDAGQRVLAALMEADRVALCGAKGVPDAARCATRGGSTRSQVVLGGQRIAVRRPRARSLTEGELPLPGFEWAASGDPLEAATMAATAAGVSTRRYASTQEPVPAIHRPGAASKSAVLRRFVQLSQEQLAHCAAPYWPATPEARATEGTAACVKTALAGVSATGVDTAEGASGFGVQALAGRIRANAAGCQMGAGIMTFDGVSLKHRAAGSAARRLSSQCFTLMPRTTAWGDFGRRSLGG